MLDCRHICVIHPVSNHKRGLKVPASIGFNRDVLSLYSEVIDVLVSDPVVCGGADDGVFRGHSSMVYLPRWTE